MKIILYSLLLFQIVSSKQIIFSNGRYENNWYEDKSTCITSTTGKYDNQFILYTQMETDSYLSLHHDTPIPFSSYKTFSFGLLWEDQFCNLRLSIAFENRQKGILIENIQFEPPILQHSKWNRIVVNISSIVTNETSFDTIRIQKIDRKDTTLFMNDFQLTTEDILPGIYEYQLLSSENQLDSNEKETNGTSSYGYIFYCLLLFIYIFL